MGKNEFFPQLDIEDMMTITMQFGAESTFCTFFDHTFSFMSDWALHPSLSEKTEPTSADLDGLVGARGEQVSSGGLVVHVHNAVLAVVEGGCGRSAEGHKECDGEKLRAQRVSVRPQQRPTVTHSSSVMDSWQLSHTRTSNSKPMRGMVERLDEHLPHTAWPHFLQWCWVKHNVVNVTAVVSNMCTFPDLQTDQQSSVLLPLMICF